MVFIAAVLRVGLRVTARTIDFNETGGAGNITTAFVADCAGSASKGLLVGATSATMIGVSFDIDASAITCLVAGRAIDTALAINADLTVATGFAALTAVLGVGLGITADSAALLELRAAGRLASTLVAALIRPALSLTITAIIGIYLGVDAGLITDDLTI